MRRRAHRPNDRPGRSRTLIRNRYFHAWAPETQPGGNVDRIQLTLGVGPDAQVEAVAAGDADVAMDPAATGRLDELLVRYPAQLHLSQANTTAFIYLNNASPPFNDVRVRRALNLAIDRQRIIQILGGGAALTPTCQQLPPNFPGYSPYCPYTSHPAPKGAGPWSGTDFVQAHRLVERSGTSGMHVTFEHPDDWTPIAKYMVQLLRDLGYRASERTISGDYADAGTTFQMIGGDDWIADYPAASNFIATRF